MTKLISTILTITLITAAFLQASNACQPHCKNNCRLKYSGIMYIEDDESQAITVVSKSNNLTSVYYEKSETDFKEVEVFEFYECKLDGYNNYPEEHGFLIARSVSKEYCATAFESEIDQGNGQNVSYSICHKHCEYDASSMEIINRQLVKATYEEDRVQITYEGSPNNKTCTGFNQPYAYYHYESDSESEEIEVVMINNEPNGSKMAMRNVTVHPSTCMEPGKRTTNEENIVQSSQSGRQINFESMPVNGVMF